MTQSMSDPYAVLGIPRNASQQTALEAYRRLAKQFHPDVAADPAAGERMRRINEAWRILSIPTGRSRQDTATAWRPANEPPRPVVQDEPGMFWPVIVVAVGAPLLFFSMVGFLPPLFVVLLVLGASRIFTGLR